MTTELPPPPPPAPSDTPPPPPGAPSPKKTGLYVLLACVGLGVAFVLFGAIVSVVSPKTTTTTRQSDFCVDHPTVDSCTGVSTPPTTAGPTTTAAPTTTAPPPHKPTPEDFKLELIETSRSCFGSAGCNVKYKIEPTYVGPSNLDVSRSYTVIYEVTGGDDVKTDNFTLRGDKWSGSSEDYISTPPNPTLTATVTRIA
jgi:hypothetical protein